MNSATKTAACQGLDASRIDRHHLNIDALTSWGWCLGVYQVSQYLVAGANHRGAKGFVLQKLFDDRLEGEVMVTDVYAVEIWTDTDGERTGTCTCSDHKHRQRDCKHIRGLNALDAAGDLLDAEGVL